MTLYTLASVTASSSNPTVIADFSNAVPPANLLQTQLFQLEVNGPSTCTATFQPMGSLDAASRLAPQGTGGAWSNIGSATTITCTTPGITPAVTTVTSQVPFLRYGCAVTVVQGVGAVATVLFNG